MINYFIDELFSKGRDLFRRKQSGPEITLLTTTLPGSLRVATRSIPHEPHSTIAVMVGAGSSDEVEGNHPRGVAHYFEHLPFRGSYKAPHQGGEFSPLECENRIALMGGSINAVTGLDDTTYIAKVPSQHVPQALSMLASLVCRPKLDPLQIDLERPAIHIEWLSNQLNIEKLQAWRILERAHNYHPLFHPVIGTEETILSMQQADLLRFHREKYKCGNTVVVLEGDVDHDAVVEQIDHEFNLPKGHKPSFDMPPYTGGMAIFPETVPGTRVQIGFHCEGQSDHSTQSIYTMVAHALGGGASPKLLHALRPQQGLIYDIQCNNSHFTDLMVISFNTFPHKVGKALEIISQELHAMADRFDSNTLDQKKVEHRNSHNEFIRGYKIGVYPMAYHLLTDGQVLLPNYFYDKFQSITTGQIENAVKKMLQEPPTVVISGDASHVPSYEKICALFLMPKERPNDGPSLPSREQRLRL